MPSSAIQRALERIRAEFEAQPGLELDAAGIARRCQIDGPLCQSVLDALVDAGVLCVRPNAAYARPRESASRRLRML